MALASARRVLILGPSGSGKSTLAMELARRLGVPAIHLDALYWKAGWVESSREEFRERLADALDRQPEWVMDGNYSYTLDLRLPLADHVIYLDASRWRCLANAVRRWREYRGKQRPDMAEGCPEKIDIEFVSWILWVQRRGLSAIQERLRASGKPLTLVRAGREAERWLARVDASYG